MTSTVFTPYVTPVPSTWLNDVNGHTYSNTPISPAITVHPASVIAASAASNNSATTVQGQLSNVGSATGASNVGYTPTGTGAVATTVQEKLNNRVNLLDFIPLNLHAAIIAGNSTVDVSAYIQLALDSKPNYLTIYGGGYSYCLTSGVILKGAYKTLDLEGGMFFFVTASALYGITLRTTVLTSAGAERSLCVKNAYIDFASSTAVGGCIGVYMQGKILNGGLTDCYIRSVKGYGVAVQGAVDAVPLFMSPDKGHLHNVTTDQCSVGIYFIGVSAATMMTGWSLINCYAPTCGTAFYIMGCAEFSMVGLNTESYTNYGLHLDDLLVGGGHVVSGGFFESGTGVSTYIQNVNPANPNFLFYKGSSGTTQADLLNTPAVTVGFGSVYINKETSVLCTPADSVPILLTVNNKGTKVSITGNGPATTKTTFAEYYLGGDVAGTTFTPRQIFTTDATYWTTTKGSGGVGVYKINIYYSAVVGSEYANSPTGYYLQNQAVASGNLFPYLSIKTLFNYN